MYKTQSTIQTKHMQSVQTNVERNTYRAQTNVESNEETKRKQTLNEIHTQSAQTKRSNEAQANVERNAYNCIQSENKRGKKRIHTARKRSENKRGKKYMHKALKRSAKNVERTKRANKRKETHTHSERANKTTDTEAKTSQLQIQHLTASTHQN